MSIPLSEVFYSIEGEGLRQGLATVFCRFSGCNIRCSFCDTVYAQEVDPNGDKFTSKELTINLERWLMQHNCNRLTFTGGEPLLQEKFIVEFVKNHPVVEINIETNGTIDFSRVMKYKNVMITADIKLLSSGQYDMSNHQQLNMLRAKDVVKAVVSNIDDLGMLSKFLTKYKGNAQVYIHPAWGVMDLKTLCEYAKDHPVRVGVQLHKYAWPPDMRGV